MREPILIQACAQHLSPGISVFPWSGLHVSHGHLLASSFGNLEVASISLAGVLTQAALLLRHAPTVVADSFCVSRLTGGWRGTLGSMAMSQARALMDRALVEA